MVNTERKPIIYRVLIAKTGFDGHDRGMRMVARALRDAGMEVIYLGIHNTLEEIGKAAIEENVDIIGLSILTDTHMFACSYLLQYLKEHNSDIPVFLGGFIPDEDLPELKEMGVSEVMASGTPLDTIVQHMKNTAREYQEKHR